MTFTDRLMTAPRWVLYTVAGLLFAGIAGALLYSMGFFQKPVEEEVREVSLVGVPDAENDRTERTKLQEYQMSEYSSPSDYWDSLAGVPDETMSAPGETTAVGEEYLDPAVYSELERYYIRNGTRTRAQVDAEHEREARERAEESDAGRKRSEPRPLTQAQQDSIYFARIERAYGIAAKYSAPAQQAPAAQAVEPESVDVEEERYRSLETEPSVLPVDAMGSGIISSLDDASDERIRHSGVRSHPVKATFLKNENLTSGQRVIMRLMQDLSLSDGTMIPANTHITGTVEVGRRMKISVSMLHYGGRMFPTDLSVYDNDGTEGIYCPLVEPRSKGSAKRVAKDVATGAASAAATIFTGNILAARGVSSVMSEATRNIGTDGTVSVSVASGYEFYIYENVKEDR